MGLRVKRGVGSTVVKIEKAADRSTRALRRVHSEGADRLAEVAFQMAPRLSGNLETSIERTDVREGRRISSYISASAVNPKTGFDYALYMHEGDYNLGPGSLQKQQGSRFKVGRKYLTRAMTQVFKREGLMQKAIDAVRRGLK